MSEATITGLDSSQRALESEVVEHLRRALDGQVLRPGDEGYDEARRVWNGMIERRPGLIVRCADVADVVEVVALANQHDLLVSVKGGGHGVAGHAVCDGGLMIDLSLMRDVSVDPEAHTVRAQAGANWGDVDRATQAHGLATPGGIVSDTGIAGLTLGGGLSWMRRKHGMSIDNLTSVDIVTPDGEARRASETENEELFWGVRGGGGNFGVVTSFEYRCHPLGPEVMFAATMYPVEEAERVLHAWRDYIATAPDEVTSDAGFWGIPDHPAFPEQLRGRPIVFLAGLYAGPADEGERMLAPLRQVTTPVLDLSGARPYLDVQTTFDPFFPKWEQCYYFKSTYLEGLSDEAVDTMIDHFGGRPSPKTLVSIRHLGGAIGRVGAAATAFGDRSAELLLSIDCVWDRPEDSGANIEWARAFWTDMQRFSTGAMYFNFPGLLEEGDSLMRGSFGQNYERLAVLKQRYDPKNLFRLNQNIQPADGTVG